MPQKSSPPFWIPGGVLLLIVCILVSPLHSYASNHVHSDLGQRIVLVATWFLRAVGVAGIICIVVGIILAFCRKQAD